MSDVRLIYIILQIMLFVVFAISGSYLSKSKTDKQYWKTAIFPILSFAIISGLRFGRDIDYNVYYFIYTDKSIYSEYEFLFYILVSVFNILGVPYYVFILFCSIFLIISFLFLLRKFKKYAFFVLPLFLNIMGIENLIRWYLAFSFILIAITMLIESRYIIAIALSIASYYIHEGMVIPLFIMAFFYFFANKKIFKPEISIALYMFTLFLGSIDLLLQLVSLLDYVDYTGSERAQSYIERADIIAKGEMTTGIAKQTIINKIRLLILFVFPIYFGGKYFRENKFELSKTIWLYNLAVFAIIIMPIFSRIEIFNRISSVFICFSYIIVGVSTYIAYKQRFFHKTVSFCLLISFLFSIYPIVKVPFDKTKDNKMLYIWDANGRKYLPY